MCNFFSLISDGRGNIFFLDAEQRAELRVREPHQNSDSHSYIAKYYGLNEDVMNKWEYSPLTQVLVKDQSNTMDDHDIVEKKVRVLSMSAIVPELIVKPIIHPFELPKQTPNKRDLADLKKWASVRDSVRDSVWASVGDSVGDSVGASIWDAVWASVGASVRDSVRDSVWASVGDSVWDAVGDSVGASVWDSVWDAVGASVGDSVGAYAGSFVNLPKWQHIKHHKGTYPFQSVVKLWGRGLVPSFDGKTWRLHSGPQAEVVWEGKI